MKIKVAASILSADLVNLQSEIDEVEKYGVDMIHIDVMDRHFVPNLTFGAPLVRGLQTDLAYDIHLMVENPENYIEDFAKALPRGRKPKDDIITVHIEACRHIHRVVQQIKEAGFRVGIALNPGTSLALIEEIVEEVDMVLIMTVNPGFSGQKFIASCLNKVRELRANFPNLDIEVDGGVDDKTAALCIGAGANVLVSASYLFGSKNRREAINSLRNTA
jgi:ribulose-phosphate 3-epimerase